MKTILLLTTVLFIINGSSASVDLMNPPLEASAIYCPLGKTGKVISLLDLSRIKVKHFAKLTGEKMNFIKKLQFKLVQRQLKNSINPDGTISKKNAKIFSTNPGDAPKGFHLGGFLLGFFLGGWIVGLIIPYLFHDANRDRRINWAWAGFGMAVLIILIAVLIWIGDWRWGW